MHSVTMEQHPECLNIPSCGYEENTIGPRPRVPSTTQRPLNSTLIVCVQPLMSHVALEITIGDNTTT